MERRRKTVVRFVAVAALAAALVAWAVAGTLRRGPVVGRPLPEVELADMDGRRVSLLQFPGRPLVIRVSSRSCAFCGYDFALLLDLQRRHPEVQVIAVELDDAATVLRELRGQRPPYPVLVDPGGESARRWAVGGLPWFLFVDAEGRFLGSMWSELGTDRGRATVEAYVARMVAGVPRAGSAAVRHLTPQELDTLLRTEDVTLVNVHVPYEGRIPGTDLFVPYDRIDAELARLPRDRQAPAIAAERLVELGYTRVMNLLGGMVAWQQAGFPLER